MKNCEGSTGTHNRLLMQGSDFQLIEAPRGGPFGGGAGHRNGLAFPESTGIVQFFIETLMNGSSHPNHENH